MIRLPRLYWLDIHYSGYRRERGDKGVASGTECHVRTKTCAFYRAGGLAEHDVFAMADKIRYLVLFDQPLAG